MSFQRKHDGSMELVLRQIVQNIHGRSTILSDRLAARFQPHPLS